MEYIAIIGGLLKLWNDLRGQINTINDAAHQAGELTDEQHQDILDHMNEQAELPHWIPRPDGQ